MEENNVKELIRVWFHKAQVETDIFSKFVFLWFCFNAWLAFKSNRETDGNMINWLKRNRSSDLYIAYQSIIDSEADSTPIEELVNLSPIYGEVSHQRLARRADIRINDKNDFDNLIEAIYRIRCNLFHGRKDADLRRDQELVQACGNILEAWMQTLTAFW